MRRPTPTQAPPRARRTIGRRSVVAALVATAALALPLLVAGPAEAVTYPTWADVQAAQGNEAATQTEIGVVQTALQGLQTQAATASQQALVAASAAADAETALQAATAQATSLRQQAATATTTATNAATNAGQLAARLYRSGDSGTVESRIFGSRHPEQLLYQLGTLDQLSSTWSGVMEQASVAANEAASLRDQASRAEDERSRLAADAEQKSSAARSAEQAAQQQVADAQSHSDELYAQLATLKNTTAEVEQQYAIGQAVAAQAAAQERARQAAAAAARRTSTSSAAVTNTSYPDPTGVVADPAGAKAYAQQAIGVYGWGSDQYSCLVSLWTQESGWRANALNSSSGAYGIPQALPASKMATAGADWLTNQDTQINWGLAYIKSAYGSPCAAWNHEMSVNPHWY